MYLPQKEISVVCENIANIRFDFLLRKPSMKLIKMAAIFSIARAGLHISACSAVFY